MHRLWSATGCSSAIGKSLGCSRQHRSEKEILRQPLESGVQRPEGHHTEKVAHPVPAGSALRKVQGQSRRRRSREVTKKPKKTRQKKTDQTKASRKKTAAKKKIAE